MGVRREREGGSAQSAQRKGKDGTRTKTLRYQVCGRKKKGKERRGWNEENEKNGEYVGGWMIRSAEANGVWRNGGSTGRGSSGLWGVGRV